MSLSCMPVFVGHFKQYTQPQKACEENARALQACIEVDNHVYLTHRLLLGIEASHETTKAILPGSLLLVLRYMLINE